MSFKPPTPKTHWGLGERLVEKKKNKASEEFEWGEGKRQDLTPFSPNGKSRFVGLDTHISIPLLSAQLTCYADYTTFAEKLKEHGERPDHVPPADPVPPDIKLIEAVKWHARFKT
jgi:hypothetical protein